MGDIQQSAQQKLYQHYLTATEMLCKRILGEPYNLHRIEGQIKPEMLINTNFAEIISECLKQFANSGSYSASTVALSLTLDIGHLQELSMQESEVDLVTAFNFFYDAYCRYAETEIINLQIKWLLDGDTNTEILSKAEKSRREKGIGARVFHSDGKEDFEKELFASFEGIVYDYPVKPFLSSLRSSIPFYEPGDYVVVAMLSGGGKSYFALNQILYSANQGIPSVYINLENAPKNVQKRLWQMDCDLKFERDFSGMGIDELMRMKASWEQVKSLPIKSVNPGPNLANIISCIREQRYEFGIELAVIDYAQLISIPGYRGGGRHNELADISAKFRALSLELEIPIMVLAQVKQEVMQKPDKRAHMYDIADCKNFTQDATLILLPYRPEYVKVLEREVNGAWEPYPTGYADIFGGKGRETGMVGAECRFNHIKGFYDIPTIFEQRLTLDNLPDWKPSAGIVANRTELDLDPPF